jgi:hypothetical protein
VRLDAAYAAARVECDVLERRLRSGLASAQQVSDCQAAIAAFDAVETAREAAIQDIIGAAETGLAVAKAATLTMIRGNRSWRLPLQYLVEDRDQADWVYVRDCLDNERISADFEEEPDDTLQAHLTTVDANSDVSAAKPSLDVSLGGGDHGPERLDHGVDPLRHPGALPFEC